MVCSVHFEPVWDKHWKSLSELNSGSLRWSVSLLRRWNCVFSAWATSSTTEGIWFGSRGAKNSSLSKRTSLLRSPQLHTWLVLVVISPGVKWPEHEDDLLHPSDIVKVDRAVLLPSRYAIMTRTVENLFIISLFCTWAVITQSVQRLAKDWTVRVSNPGGGRDFPHPSRQGPTQPPIQGVPGLSLR